MNQEEYEKRYNDMMWLYRMLSVEAQTAPSVFYGMHDRVIKNDPFNPYHHNDVTGGIRFRVHHNHNCVGVISVSHDGETITVNSQFLHSIKCKDKREAFNTINKCIRQLTSLAPSRREWGNWKYVYDLAE